MLKNRLLVEDFIARHPEALDRPVVAPIVVAGLPRTGTTHLHNALSADPALRSLPYWEAVEPLPAPGEPAGSIEPRVERCSGGLDMSELWIPELKRMHEMTPWHTHEEIHLLALDCSTMLFDTLAPMPTWRTYYRATDQTPHYEYLYRVLQVLQYARGGDALGAQVTAAPRAVRSAVDGVPRRRPYVLTHRDPGEVIVSMMTMIAYTARTHLERSIRSPSASYWHGPAHRPAGRRASRP